MSRPRQPPSNASAPPSAISGFDRVVMDVVRTVVNSTVDGFDGAHPHGCSKVLNAFLSTTAAAYVLSYGPERAARVLYTLADQVATTKHPLEENE